MAGNEDWRIRNANNETVKQEQKDKNNWSIGRIGAIIFAAVIVMAKNFREEFEGFATSDLPDFAVIIVLVVLLGVLPVILGLIILMSALKKRRQNNTDFYERPQQSEERYTAHTRTTGDYAETNDSWDIKDPKPPWEL